MRRGRSTRLAALTAACAGLAACALDGAEIGHAAAPVREGAPTGEFPEVVALVHGEESFCTGVVVAPRLVLTAAHCAVPPAPGLDAVLFGAAVDDAAAVAVDGLQLHPDYDAATLAHDLALVELAEEVDVPAAAAAGPAGDEMAGEEVLVVGFGAARPLGPRDTKRVGTSRIEDAAPGSLRLEPAPDLPCGGDSGGPVFWSSGDELLLLATVSRGDLACLDHVVATPLDPGDPLLAPALSVADPPLAGRDGGCAAGQGAPPPPGLVLVCLAAAVAVRCRRSARRR